MPARRRRLTGRVWSGACLNLLNAKSIRRALGKLRAAEFGGALLRLLFARTGG